MNDLKKELLAALGRKEAMLAMNYYNAETLKGVLLAAGSVGRPVILQLSRSTIEYLGLKVATELGRAALAQYGVKGWIHLDHGDTPELVQQCLDAGFDSVMIDASEKPFRENIEISARVVRMAEKYSAHVEAELGYVAKLGQSSDRVGFTDPGDAMTFAEHTGVDALAVAIGTVHGFYREEPMLDLERLALIHSMVPIPLVLHGASGVPPVQLRKAIREGICKINIATDIKDIFMRTVKESLSLTDEIDIRKVFPPAIDAVKELVVEKYKTIIL